MSGELNQYDANAYRDLLISLLPPGPWNLEPDAVVFRFYTALAQELARVDGRAGDLWEESDPATTDELLPETEKMFGLTDSTGTIDERRARIQTRALSRIDFSARPADYQRVLAPVLDLDPSQVVVIEISRATADATFDRHIYRFYVYRNPALPGTPQLAFAQDELTQISHTHTLGTIIQSIDFLCDDPLSLTDRDLLGV